MGKGSSTKYREKLSVFLAGSVHSDFSEEASPQWGGTLTFAKFKKEEKNRKSKFDRRLYYSRN